jgi:hypothetical protein
VTKDPDVSVVVHLTFREPERVSPPNSGFRIGAITLERDWVFVIPKLDPAPVAPFVFYVWNMNVSKFVQLGVRPVVTVAGGRTVPVVQPVDGLNQPLNPDPWPAQ